MSKDQKYVRMPVAVTLRNDFHNTEAVCAEGMLSVRQAATVRAKLCGVAGCTCGGDLGERGSQRQAHGMRLEIIPDGDSSEVEVRMVRVY